MRMKPQMRLPNYERRSNYEAAQAKAIKIYKTNLESSKFSLGLFEAIAFTLIIFMLGTLFGLFIDEHLEKVKEDITIEKEY